ncbi:MAG: hypothetical protein AVDCRST_MAG01-01-383, partial [uncultured Rubrobacteraceae bacterium]
GEDRLVVAGDARRVRQVGDRLPAPRVVGEAGPLASHPPRSGRGERAGADDEEAQL